MDSFLLKKIESLPESLQKQVSDFIDFLISKANLNNTKTPQKLKKHVNFSWEGSLKQDYQNISSVELQHKIRE